MLQYDIDTHENLSWQKFNVSQVYTAACKVFTITIQREIFLECGRRSFIQTINSGIQKVITTERSEGSFIRVYMELNYYDCTK